ncbi:MAG: hypothetical protein QM727_02175 [Niabella sp.]
MIPQTFEQWVDCIVNRCGINLTKEFAQKRLAIYQDRNNMETQKLVSLYGEQHLENIIHWLKQV